MSPESFPTYQSQARSTEMPIVDIDWIKQCLLELRYITPEKFSIRPDDKSVKPDKSNIHVTIESLDKMADRLDPSERMLTYLSNCVFYLFKIESNEEAIQKRLIHMGGGMHMIIQVPNITHVVVDNFEEEDLVTFNQYTNVLIVNTTWLRECLRLKARIPESEFMVKPHRRTQLM